MNTLDKMLWMNECGMSTISVELFLVIIFDLIKSIRLNKKCSYKCDAIKKCESDAQRKTYRIIYRFMNDINHFLLSSKPIWSYCDNKKYLFFIKMRNFLYWLTLKKHFTGNFQIHSWSDSNSMLFNSDLSFP